MEARGIASRLTVGTRQRRLSTEGSGSRPAFDHPVHRWEHEGAGSITWGAHLDRLAPLGEEAVSVVKAAWAQRREDPRERTRREQDVSQPVDRHPTTVTSIKPGWAGRVESSWGVG